jgi:hypothetical protein
MFTKKDDDCRLIVQLKDQGQKVYGVNHFTLTEVGGSRGVLNAQAASDTNTVGFGVGVQGKDMPKAIPVNASDNSQKLIITNATTQSRTYIGDLGSETIFKSIKFSIPPKASCYVDYGVVRSSDLQFGSDIYIPLTWQKNNGAGRFRYFSDITNPLDPIFNGIYHPRTNNLQTCSSYPLGDCTSNKWASINLGLANLGTEDLPGGRRAGEIETLINNSWGSNSFIYWETSWFKKNTALLLIQGSTDGSGFDANAAAPSILEIKSAPPCSDYIKGDPSVTYKVIADVYGPGSVTMSGGKQCVIVKVPNSEFTRCTGSGIKDRIYEITAVPEAGKTFKGWNSKGLCDDAKTTCRFPLTSEVSIQPLFW